MCGVCVVYVWCVWRMCGVYNKPIPGEPTLRGGHLLQSTPAPVKSVARFGPNISSIGPVSNAAEVSVVKYLQSEYGHVFARALV